MATSWYFSNDELVRGLNPDEQKQESSQRRGTCAFLQDAGMKLRLPQLTIATAVIFFHRFYARYRFREYDRYMIGTTCLFLAGKVEETPKKLKDVIEVTYTIRYKGKEPPKVDSPEFNQLKEQILTHELIVLRTIAFDLTVEHPYKYLLSYVKGIQGNRSLAQVAWNFVNDSLRTTLCLQHKPQLIASAAIFLASKFLKYQLPEGKKPWWEVFDARIDDLEAISGQILDLYDSTTSASSVKPNSSSFNNDNEMLKNYNPSGASTQNQPSSDSNILSTPASQEKQSSSSQAPSSALKNSSQTTPIRSPTERDTRDRDSRDKDRSDRDSRDKDRTDRDKDRGLKRRTRSRSPRSRSRSPRSRSRSPRSRSRSPRSPRSRRGPVRNHERDQRNSRSGSSSRDGNSSRNSNSSSTSLRNSSSNSTTSNTNSLSRSRSDHSRGDERGGRYHPYE